MEKRRTTTHHPPPTTGGRQPTLSGRKSLTPSPHLMQSPPQTPSPPAQPSLSSITPHPPTPIPPPLFLSPLHLSLLSNRLLVPLFHPPAPPPCLSLPSGSGHVTSPPPHPTPTERGGGWRHGRRPSRVAGKNEIVQSTSDSFRLDVAFINR